MAEDAKVLVEHGADGIVIGCLDKEGNVDVEAVKKILKAIQSEKVSLTFHRAFDLVRDPFKAAETIIDLGFHRILTSGQVRKMKLPV